MAKNRELRLNTPKNLRNSCARLTRQFYRNEGQEDETPTWWRTLVQLLNQTLAAHKLEAELDIEKRVERIEEALRARGDLK